MVEVPGPQAPRAVTRVLVAEDDSVSRRVALAMLTRLGCEVDLAVNGREAAEAARDYRYDLILMDCHMPELDGFDASRVIREGGASAETPIIATTAADDWQRCELAGMNDYLRKPIRQSDYARVLRTWTAASIE